MASDRVLAVFLRPYHFEQEYNFPDQMAAGAGLLYLQAYSDHLDLAAAVLGPLE